MKKKLINIINKITWKKLLVLLGILIMCFAIFCCFKYFKRTTVTHSSTRNTSTTNYVINEEPKMKFKCVSPTNSLIDEIIFNKNKENMNNSVRMYEYTFDEKEYSNMIETVIDGTIKINENEGNAILDYQNKKITILKDLPKETLDSEYGGSFPTTYSEVSNYYRNSLKYTCSFN